MSQEWLNQRLRGLQPDDFEDAARLYSTAGLTAPPGFENAWGIFTGAEGQVTEEELGATNSILIFCNPFVEAEYELLCQLVTAADALGHAAPPMFWVPHTTAPEVRPLDANIDVPRDNFVENVMELGLDGIIPGEPKGFRLALAVRAKIRKSASLSRTLNDIVNERRARAQQSDFLRECIHCILWDYLRLRLAASIPAVDFNLPPGPLQRVGNFAFGQLLGEGMYGQVYSLNAIGTTGDAGREVVKVVDKAGVTELQDLKAMKRMVDVMRLLSGEEWGHPAILKLHEIYHSPTHVLFRMEYGGPENLYRRLSHRQKSGDKCRPLSFERTASLLRQAVEVVAHMHLGPHVCHRDLKPENFIVLDSQEEFLLRLADFDLAVVFDSTTMFRNPCGTVTFTAPEVILEKEYSGAAADIWSLGVVLLEVLCNVRVVENVLNLQVQNGGRGQGGSRPNDDIAKRIRAGFQSPGSAEKMMQDNCRADLQGLLPSCLPLLSGMLTTAPGMRWDAQRMLDHLVELPT